MSLTVTADELDALARRLGATRFPGVAGSLFDTVEPRHHRLLTDRLLATLTARNLIGERDDRVVAAPEVARLLGPTLRGAMRYEVEQVDGDSHATMALGATDGAVVLHRASGPYHCFDLIGTDGDVAAALAALVDPSPGPPAPAASAFTSRRSRLTGAGERPDLVPAPFAALAQGWRRTTTITRVGTDRGVPAMTWLSIIDGGAGRIWLLEPHPGSPDGGPYDGGPYDDGLLDGDDPVVRVTPVAGESIRAHLGRICP